MNNEKEVVYVSTEKMSGLIVEYSHLLSTYASDAEPLRQRLCGESTPRVLEVGDVTYIEDLELNNKQEK